MKIKIDKWNIVLAGSWNPAIFTPNWMAKNLFNESFEPEKPDLDVECEIPVLPSIGTPIFTIKDLKLHVDEKKITITSQLSTDDILKLAENIVHRILSILPHTPFTAFGINFLFFDENPNSKIYDIFEIEDRNRIAEFAGPVKKICILRSIELEYCTLNLSVVQEAGKITYDFNFHFENSDTVASSEKIINQLAKCRDTTFGILTQVYNLNEEINDDNGDSDTQ